ncbi:MAG: hypothetical protein MK171_05775 [Pirellulales bacterium]|nr:hypothetical protein [Pirellulales bacterium]
MRASKLASRRASGASRSAISLIEILISMFVLLFGLMGVASIFPVGSYMMSEGEKFDSSSLLAQNAFEELEVRGVLRPELWLYGANPPGDEITTGTPPRFIQHQGPGLDRFNVTDPAVRPGRAFVIDPLGTAVHGLAADGDVFPFGDLTLNPAGPNVSMPTAWRAPNGPFPEERFPVRRLTLLPTASATTAMGTGVAESIFRLRDDLAVEYPEQADRPAVQLWAKDDGENLLARQYTGNYSWLATVVPNTPHSLMGLQPADSGSHAYSYDVSVVVFRKRGLASLADSERLIEAELMVGGDLVLFDRNGEPLVVDAAVDQLRPGHWICLMGVDRGTNQFALKWYRLSSLDDKTSTTDIPSLGAERPGRMATLIGPDWPAAGSVNGVIKDLRAAILPGAISVVTRTMKMEGN